jgi:FixJ family two-component response regulator
MAAKGPTAPTVFVIDDDPEIQAAMKRMLSSAGMDVVTFADAESFLQSPIQRNVPSCLLLDVRMPGMSGLGLQQRLAGQGISIPVVFLSGFGDVPTAVEAIRSGAVDFLEKPFNREALLKSVARALDLDAQMQLNERQTVENRKRLDSLTRRERDVYELLLDGKSNKEIGAALGVGLPTVTKHRARVLKKLGVKNVFELVSVFGKTRRSTNSH